MTPDTRIISQKEPKNGARESRESNFSGIKFYSGSALPDRETLLKKVGEITADRLREDQEVWRPEETLEAARLFFEAGKLNVVGDPQSGKGTILFGISEICDVNGWGYCFIDGHHQEVPAERVIKAIKVAEEKGIPIFFDSFDYLFAGPRKFRKIPVEVQEARTKAILEALDQVAVPVAITSHNEEWAAEMLNLDLRSRFNDQLLKYPSYEIPLNFISKESIAKFLISQGLPPAFAYFLTNMDRNPLVVNTLIVTFGDKGKAAEVFQALQNYPVLKEITREQSEDRELDRGRREEVEALLERLTLPRYLADEEFQEDILSLAQIILEAEHKRVFLTTLRKTR